jgi:hypothetical protein
MGGLRRTWLRRSQILEVPNRIGWRPTEAESRKVHFPKEEREGALSKIV